VLLVLSTSHNAETPSSPNLLSEHQKFIQQKQFKHHFSPQNVRSRSNFVNEVFALIAWLSCMTPLSSISLSEKKKLEFCYTHVNNHNKRPSCNSFNTLLCRNPSPRFLAPSDPILFTFFHIHNHEIIPFKRCSHDFLQIRFNEIKAVLTFRASPNSDAPSSLISFTELYTQ